MSGEEINAHQWLRVAQNSLDNRIAEYNAVGNPQAAENLIELHQSTLDTLKNGVDSGDMGFITLLSELEQNSSDGDPDERANYVTAHGLQLDELATMVRNAQARHDESR